MLVATAPNWRADPRLNSRWYGSPSPWGAVLQPDGTRPAFVLHAVRKQRDGGCSRLQQSTRHAPSVLSLRHNGAAVTSTAPPHKARQRTRWISHRRGLAHCLATDPGRGISIMSEAHLQSTELTSQYSAQVAGDLERNLKEQERLSGELEALQAQLAALQHDHSVLLNIQQALGIPSAVAAPGAGSVPAVPTPRKKTSAASGSDTQTSAKKSTTPTRRRTGARGPGSSRCRASWSATTGRPSGCCWGRSAWCCSSPAPTSPA